MTMKLMSSGVTAIAALLLASTAAFASPDPSKNDSVRCSARACETIHCDSKGASCQRVRTARPQQLSDRRNDMNNDRDYDRNDHDRDSRSHDERRADGGHRVCDSDGDRCYMSEGRHWEFHGYVDTLHRHHHHHHHHHHHMMHSWRMHEDNGWRGDNGYGDRERSGDEGNDSYQDRGGYDHDSDQNRDHGNSHWTDGYGREYDNDQDNGDNGH